MANLQQEIGKAVDCLAVSIKSIREDDDVGANERTDLITQSQNQFTKYVTGLVQAGIEKRTSRADPLEDEPGRRGGGPKDFDRLNFNASGVGPAHEALWIRFDNLRRQMGPAQAHRAFELAWSELTDTEKQAVRDEEAAAEAARQAQAAAEENERKKEMNKSKLTSLAKRVVDGVDVATTHDTLFNLAKSVAAADRQEGETAEMARARYWQTPDGKVVYHALKVAKVGDVEDRPSHVAKLGPGMLALHKRADEIRRGTSMTREAAVAMIATLPAERSLWTAAKSEQLEQVS
jgi:hypothetical protein